MNLNIIVIYISIQYLGVIFGKKAEGFNRKVNPKEEKKLEELEKKFCQGHDDLHLYQTWASVRAVPKEQLDSVCEELFKCVGVKDELNKGTSRLEKKGIEFRSEFPQFNVEMLVCQTAKKYHNFVEGFQGYTAFAVEFSDETQHYFLIWRGCTKRRYSLPGIGRTSKKSKEKCDPKPIEAVSMSSGVQSVPELNTQEVSSAPADGGVIDLTNEPDEPVLRRRRVKPKLIEFSILNDFDEDTVQ